MVSPVRVFVVLLVISILFTFGCISTPPTSGIQTPPNLPPSPSSNNITTPQPPPSTTSGPHPGSLRTVQVASESELRDAINYAQPGDLIVIAPGDYVLGQQLWIAARGTATNPIYVVAGGQRGSVRIRVPEDEGFNVGDNSAYLVFENLEISNTGNTVFHVQDGANHITLRNLNLHDAGLDGDVIKVNQANFVLIEGCDVSKPGRRADDSGGNAYQEGIDFMDSVGSVIRYNYIHDFGNLGGYAKGGAGGVLFEYNLIDASSQADPEADPAFGIGGWSDLEYLRGARYESYDTIFRRNVIARARSGALALYDAYNATISDNLFIDNDRVLIQFRAGNAPAEASADILIQNNRFVDNRGRMPLVCQLHSHSLSGVRASGNLYWNNGVLIPPNGEDGGCGFVPGAELGARVQNPTQDSRLATRYTKPATYAAAMAFVRSQFN